jgi:branched-chain amino acid transport system substrate-binding protein
MKASWVTALTLAGLLCAGGASGQEITIGVTMGTTGPGASLGINYKNAFQLMPNAVDGVPIDTNQDLVPIRPPPRRTPANS